MSALIVSSSLPIMLAMLAINFVNDLCASYECLLSLAACLQLFVKRDVAHFQQGTLSSIVSICGELPSPVF